jgi:hypothetical protein
MHSNSNHTTIATGSYQYPDGAGFLPGEVNPVAEEDYWRNAYQDEAYFNSDYDFYDYGPAYALGYMGPARFGGKFEQAAPYFNKEWEDVKGTSRLNWDIARMAIRAAWDKVDPLR